MKNILLTGATGFVGRQILFSLLDKKIEVRAIVRRGKENFFKDKNSKVELITSDDLFKESDDWWAEQCKGIDTIIHVAWYAEPGKYLQSPKNIECLIGSLNLAKGAIKAGIRRFVGIGTCFEYDLNVGDLSINTPLKPSTPYAAAKAGLYTFLSELLPVQSIEFSWCRLFYLYGDGEHPSRLYPYINSQLDADMVVEMSSGKQIRDFLNVEEAARKIMKITLNDSQGAFNICSGKGISIKDFAENIADKVQKKYLLKFGVRKDNPFDPPFVVGLE